MGIVSWCRWWVYELTKGMQEVNMAILDNLTDDDVLRVYLDIAVADQILSEYDLKLQTGFLDIRNAERAHYQMAISEARRFMTRASGVLADAGCTRNFVTG